MRRQVGYPWYTVLYRQPARLWWTTPLVGAPAIAVMRKLFGDETHTAVIAGTAWLVASTPVSAWRHWHPRDGRRWDTNLPPTRPSDPD